MINVDWGLLKLQYEFFGVTVEELAEEYDTTPRMIEYAIEEQNWKRSDLAIACQDYNGVTSVKASLLDEINNRTKLMHSLKQSALNPRYIALETALLGKCLDLLKNTPTDDPASVIPLKTISEIFKSLKEQNYGVLKPEDKKSEALQINIMNKVGGGAKGEKEEITISVDKPALASA